METESLIMSLNLPWYLMVCLIIDSLLVGSLLFLNGYKKDKRLTMYLYIVSVFVTLTLIAFLLFNPLGWMNIYTIIVVVLFLLMLLGIFLYNFRNNNIASVMKSHYNGCYIQYHTTDYKYTFGIGDVFQRPLVFSCLKYNDVFMLNEFVRLVRDSMDEATIEDQTNDWVLKQTYPKFIIFEDDDMYYFDYYLNNELLVMESKAYESKKEVLEDLNRVRNYARSSTLYVAKESLDATHFENVDSSCDLISKAPKNLKKSHLEDNPSIEIADNKDSGIENVEAVKSSIKEKDSMSKSFEAKLYLNTKENKKYYSLIKNEILSYEGVYSKIAFKHETFKCDGKMIMKMQVRGSKIAILCPISPSEFEDSKFKFVKIDEFSTHTDTPLLYKVYNSLRVKYAKQIIAGVMEKFEIAKNSDYIEEDFASIYEGKTTEDLIKEGEIRLQ